MCLVAKECHRRHGQKSRSAVAVRFDESVFQPSCLVCFLGAYPVKVQGLHALPLCVFGDEQSDA